VTLRRVGQVSVARGAKPGFDHADVFTRAAGSWMGIRASPECWSIPRAT